MSKKVKIPLIIICSLLFIACICVDAFYIYIKYFAGNKKVVSSTFELALQTLADGETKKPFLEVAYYSNKKNNGLELFDVKYNYLMDENKTNFFSQGLQYVGTKEKSIYENFETFVLDDTYEKSYKKEGAWYSGAVYYYHNWFGRYTPDVYNYQSSNDYETTTLSTNPIDNNSFFKIDLNGTIYGMRFKSNYKIASDGNFIGQYKIGYENHFIYTDFDYGDFYAYMDHNYFNKVLFYSIAGMKPGTDQYVIFEFGDLFDYYVFNESTSTYNLVVKENFIDEARKIDKNAQIDTTGLLGKVYKEVKSYFAIKVSIFEDGAMRASDSLFNSVEGSQNYIKAGLKDEASIEDYFIGRSVIDLTINDFKLVQDGSSLELALTDEARNKWWPYRDKIVLRAYIASSDLNDNVKLFYDKSFDGFKYIAHVVEV